jgi:hypothetical protein
MSSAFKKVSKIKKLDEKAQKSMFEEELPQESIDD